MKKAIKQVIISLMIVATVFIITACNDNQGIAGTWEGTVDGKAMKFYFNTDDTVILAVDDELIDEKTLSGVYTWDKNENVTITAAGNTVAGELKDNTLKLKEDESSEEVILHKISSDVFVPQKAELSNNSLGLKQDKIKTLDVHNRLMPLESGGLYSVSAELKDKDEIKEVIEMLNRMISFL